MVILAISASRRHNRNPDERGHQNEQLGLNLEQRLDPRTAGAAGAFIRN
jgi:hypothetical protein